MKKIMGMMILLVMMISVVGCTSNSNTGTTEEEYSDEGESSSVFIEPELGKTFVDETTILPTTYPIYMNEYPNGEEGALYEYDENIKTSITNYLSQFLDILYGENLDESYEITDAYIVDNKVLYDNGKSKIYSGVSGISMLTAEYEVDMSITVDNIQDNDLLKAAIAYLDIKTPQLTFTIEYDDDGMVYDYEYKITEESDDLFTNIINNSFSYIRVICHPDIDDIALIIYKVDMPEKVGDYEIITYSEALKALQAEYRNIDVSGSKCEISYSPNIQTGYYIPCYRFYIEDTPDIVEDIPMAEVNTVK
jgi:hypothetical protein